MLLDLDDLQADATPRAIRVLCERATVMLISGIKAIRPELLEPIMDNAAELVLCSGSNGDRNFAPLIARLVAFTGRQDPRATAHAILAKNLSWLDGLEQPVVALCADPWGLRRPSQLARRVGLTQRELKVLCATHGYARAEHFITEVRVAGRDFLMAERGFSVAGASRLMGIKDASNFRRQRTRAAQAVSRGTIVARVLIATSVLTSCQGANDDAQAVPPDSARERGDPVALPVVGSLVERGDLVITVRTTGRVRSDRLVSLKSETQGTVLEVNLRPGDRVAAGAVVARFDPRPFDLAVREAEGAVADARVRFNDLILGDQPGDTSEVTRVRHENARLRSGLIGAEARLERAQLDRESATFRAPFAGVVDEVGVVPGQRIGAGEFVARIVDVANLVIEANVLEHDLGLLRPGGLAVVMPNTGDGRRYTGRIAAVLPLVDTTTRAGRALVRVRSQGGLRPGMYADLELESERLRGRVLVPAAAVIERDGRPLVFRVRGGKAEWVYVQLGRSNRRNTEILPDSASNIAPVVPGDTVLVAGHLTLTHDATVRVTAVARPTP